MEQVPRKRLRPDIMPAQKSIKMNIEPIAPFHLDLDRQGNLHEIHGKLFDQAAYSRMKYGVRTDLKYFARMVAEELQQQAPQLFNGVEPPAILTSYKAVAPPGTTLARYCLDIINLERFRQKLVPGEMVQVYRPKDYIEEYAILPAAERKKLLGTQTDNTLRGRSLDGYVPVILDDIYVTGGYTAMLRNVIGNQQKVVSAYIAVCSETLKKMPHAEGILNNSGIRKPADLLPFIERQDFVCTRRFLKMLLRTSLYELKPVVSALPDILLEQIARGIIDTDSELQFIFPDTANLLIDAALERRCI